ncbi:GIY-YIG catalytic domain-containing endonuclease [Acanthocystis turfacea Chlorella virus MO0605SPH]|nr:GIY-YIG catalytic domain-containing endonuclease [Acanthocystis turfacea Chlorella virus MO0605SPH]AGE60198.1 GIY-YIG catalytic domain-containing endonuclease [Acanthocystis turfacea Chlorella virus WI0606]
MGFIYMLISPYGKSYIGQTTRPIEERFREHQTKPDCVAIYGAIQKHGWESFEKHWYEVPDEELNQHEELMVEVLGTLAPGGYNLKEGGGSGGKLCEEVKQKMSKSLTGDKNPMFGKTHTDNAKEKMSVALTGLMSGEKNPMFGRTHTDDAKKKISEKMSGTMSGEKNPMFGRTGESSPFYGRTHPDEVKQKMSDAKIGDKHHRSSKVYQYELDGTFTQSFCSGGEAARSLNKKGGGSNICACAHGKCPTAYGFKWSFTEL